MGPAQKKKNSFCQMPFYDLYNRHNFHITYHYYNANEISSNLFAINLSHSIL